MAAPSQNSRRNVASEKRPPKGAVPTVRYLAKLLKVSPTTVSEALRDLPRVRVETRLRIQKAADALAYRPNPLASAVMSEMRKNRRSLFRGMLAAVALDEPERPPAASAFFRAILEGATNRAKELGFGLETFLVGPRGVKIPRLDAILQSRGIRGVLILPAWDPPDFSRLNWRNYAGVYTDYLIENPALHSICSDHHRSMTSALERLHARGYRRPGLFLKSHQDQRLQRRWEAAFLAFQRHAPGLETVPPLVSDTIDRASFNAWFRRHRPDVVLGHDVRARDWMRECGAKIPDTHGFFCLNLAEHPEPCAGLDQQPEWVGARATEIVVGELHRNQFGIPDHPSLTTIVARWVDGPTIRGA
ncbi:LacI family transcriptional regulator [Opitutaceae bacterium EW11]|nr:LacI family transcriptional regulator [Opitutaceae bacterium EW11]